MIKNMSHWETLERDSSRGFQILGRPTQSGWEIEVRFDNEQDPRRPASDRMAETRAQALTTGRELATMG